MQRIAQICCRLSTQTARNNFLSHHVNSSSSVPTGFAQSVVPQRCKHTTGERDEAAEPEVKLLNEREAPAPFSGYIPVEELEFSYSRSGGPGGQHVNKVNTKVEVRFHVASASWLPQDIKSKLLEVDRNRITKEGFLVLTSERTRKQMLNQADVMDKLRSMVHRAAAKPRGLTDEEIDLRDKRLHKAKEHSLREKRRHSVKKQSRGSQNL